MKNALTGFKVINKEKLKALGQEDLNQLFASDGLELVYLHLHSLRNLNKMLQNAGPQATATDEHGSVH
ncbi:sapC-like S-layer protein [Vibrio ishigakensis]|uniref:SapC-like S-layer protein n=1 Tax=Vibrio ishigakensis TaxID=1481914 RepID=A0A0B8QMW7_9VIBR|nr:sapC-like S-layer protein [Vibrio ishigakensis]